MNPRLGLRNLPLEPKLKKAEIVVWPGYGNDEIRLGRDESQAKAVLGVPDKRIRKHKGHYFYIYKKKGIDLDFGKRGARLKVIFFFQKGVHEHDQARIVTERGIRLGDLRSRVLEVYGKPDETGEPFTLHTGEHFREWFYYSNGIQFRFNKKNKVDEISISRRKKKSRVANADRKRIKGDGLKRSQTAARRSLARAEHDVYSYLASNGSSA